MSYPVLTHSVVVLTALDYAEKNGLDFRWQQHFGGSPRQFDVEFLARNSSREATMSYMIDEDFGTDVLKIIQQRCERAVQEIKNDT